MSLMARSTYADPRRLLRRRRRIARLQAIGYLIMLTCGIAAAIALPELRWYIGNALLFLLLGAVVIIPHELGHALAAKLLGMRVHAICIGTGRTLFAFHALGIQFEIKLIPLASTTMTLHKTTYFARTREWFKVAAGPLVNLTLFIIAISILPPREMLIALADNAPAPFAVFAIANLFVFIFNLLPQPFNDTFGPVGPDGHALLTIPFATDKEVQIWNSSNYLIEAIGYYQHQRYDDANRVLTEGMAMYPEDAALVSTRGALLLLTGQADEAIHVYEELLKRDDLDDSRLMIATNNLAAAHLQRDNEGDLEVADRLSAQAHNAMPWVTSFRATRGSVMVTTADTHNGLDLLEGVLKELEHPRDLAATLAYIALGHHKLNNESESRQALNAAIQTDVECPALAKVQRTITL